MSDKYVLNDAGEPEMVENLIEWAKAFEKQNRSVAHTETDNGSVSTVFLGLDHSYGDGPPLLFETMIFGGPFDGEQYRYPTRAEALTGHELAVERVKAARDGR